MAGFFSKKQCSNCRQRICNEVVKRTASGVFYLRNVLQFVIDRLNQGLFLSRILSAILIREFFMLLLIFVTSWVPFKKRFSNNACPRYSLSAHSLPLMFYTNLPYFNGSRSSTLRGHEVENFTLVIDYQMQLESEEPSHRTFSTFSKPFKSLVNQSSLVAADTQRSGVYEADADTGSQ